MMTDNPSNPSNPSEPGQPRRPRRPYVRRDKGQNPSTSNSQVQKKTSDPNRVSQPPRNRQNSKADGAVKTVNNNRRGPDKGQKRSPNTKERTSNLNTHRKPVDRRQNGDFKSEDQNNHVPSVPLKAIGGIKALAENGQFGRNWWARRWIHAMEKLMDGRRLSRGQDYASQGQVLSMGEIKNGVAATVQGSRVKPYRVTIQVMPLKAEEWEKALDVLAEQAVYAAKLLAGEMPENIEDAFQSAGLSLFPERPGDLVTQCSCPDWANPCKHVAAAHYILGDRFDEDPFLLFRMRGRSKEQVLEGLRLHRGGPVEEAIHTQVEEVNKPLESNPELFWEPGDQLDSFSVQVNPPKVKLPILRRLGQPEIIRNFLMEDELNGAYESASQTAIFLAYSDSGIPVDEPATEVDEEN
jgi:uncharacterized Zn finger protein